MRTRTSLDLFVGSIQIDTSNDGVQFEVNDYCSMVESDWLERLLGATLFTDLADNEDETKYTELLKGVDESFTYVGVTKKYKGLDNYFCYIIYYLYLKDQYASNNGAGDIQPVSSGGEYMYNEDRSIRAYNKWVDAFNNAVDFINYKNSITPDTYEGFNTGKIGYINSFGI